MAVPVLSVEQEDAVLRSFNYTRKQLAQDVVLLREWLDAQVYFPESRKTEPETFLVNFIVGCKGSLEKAKKKLDKYYSIRGHGDLFTDRGTLDYHHASNNFECLVPVPTPLPDGSFVTIFSLHETDPTKFDPLSSIKNAILYTEYKLRHGTGIYAGEVILADGAGMGATHCMKMNPSLIKPLITWIQDVLPFRIRKFIVFNTNSLLDTILNTVVMPFLSNDIKEKYMVVGEGELSKHLGNIDYLPKNFGGKDVDRMILFEKFARTLASGVETILPTLDDRTDESMRPTVNGLRDNPHFGAFGTIKTLVVD